MSEGQMSTKFVMFKMAEPNDHATHILINPAYVCAAPRSGTAQVTLFMDGGSRQYVAEGNLDGVLAKLTSP
jgi:hypothetical protein